MILYDKTYCIISLEVYRDTLQCCEVGSVNIYVMTTHIALTHTHCTTIFDLLMCNLTVLSLCPCEGYTLISFIYTVHTVHVSALIVGVVAQQCLTLTHFRRSSLFTICYVCKHDVFQILSH